MPLLFSNEEYADIHFIYGVCNGNARLAAREYEHRFPHRRVPHHTVFTRTHRLLRETGAVQQRREVNYNDGALFNHQRTRRILTLFDNDPSLSIRRAAIQLNIKTNTIWRTLHADERYPYHYTPKQQLPPLDARKRIEYCEWYINSVRADHEFPFKILWTDEATFTRRGIFNYHNNHF